MIDLQTLKSMPNNAGWFPVFHRRRKPAARHW